MNNNMNPNEGGENCVVNCWRRTGQQVEEGLLDETNESEMHNLVYSLLEV